MDPDLNRCSWPIPFDDRERRPIDKLHSLAAVLANPLDGETPLSNLADARHLLEAAQDAMQQLVDDARDTGAAWTDIADALGMNSRQAAQYRYAGRK